MKTGEILMIRTTVITIKIADRIILQMTGGSRTKTGTTGLIMRVTRIMVPGTGKPMMTATGGTEPRTKLLHGLVMMKRNAGVGQTRQVARTGVMVLKDISALMNV